MSLSDPIADMLTRIRNAQRGKLAVTAMPFSKMKQAIAETLREAGYIDACSVEDIGHNKKVLSIVLKYKDKVRTPVIEGIERVSKPSCRIYVGSGEIPYVLGGLGTAILSTSRGIMTDRAARKQNVGGELLCYVW